VIVVDDGSTDGTWFELEGIGGVQRIRHRVNRGKGAALVSGMTAAASLADWAITVDADGQHDPAEAPALQSVIPQGRRPIVVGTRRHMTAAGAPWTSRFGRGFSNFWVQCAGGPPVADTQSGFRIYPLPETLELGVVARRFQYEVEVLVRACWHGLPVIESKVSVCYQPETGRISHFRPFVDFLRNTGTFSRLITARVLGLRPPRHSKPQQPEDPM
jgi:glycosyltransferase involved in cell wall biosynthesis